MAIQEAVISIDVKKCCFIYEGTKGDIRCPNDALDHSSYCHSHVGRGENKKTYRAFKESLPKSLEETYRAFVTDDDVLDLRPVLGMLKTLLVALQKEWTNALDKEELSLDISFIKKVKAVASETRQMAKSITEIEINKEAVIDIHEARRFLNSLCNVVKEEVKDADVKVKIIKRLNSVSFGDKANKNKQKQLETVRDI